MIGIVAPDGGEEQVARDLLALARSVYDVQATSDKGVFMVPQYLADAYTAGTGGEQQDETEATVTPRRGRSRRRDS